MQELDITKDNQSTDHSDKHISRANFALAKLCYDIFDHRRAFHKYLDDYQD